MHMNTANSIVLVHKTIVRDTNVWLTADRKNFLGTKNVFQKDENY